jgi:aspartate carbamoyltransferase catalytic subunit
MKLHHILETQQFKDKKILNDLFSLADKMKLFDKPNLTDEEKHICSELMLPQVPRKKAIACLFYEPSTRTRFSFENAIHSLGGNVMFTENAGKFSSAAKGESLADTIRVISGYVDAIVIRHPKEGSAKEAARYSTVPVINAGDGPGQHPTQALLDLYTIKDELKRMDNLEVALVGDLKFGRTVHSLVYLLAHRKGIKFDFIAPPEIAIPARFKEYLQKKGVAFEEITNDKDLEDVVRRCDVLYVTRIQKERFKNKKAYAKCKGKYIINEGTIDLMRTDSVIMHPLPRVNEITPAVDYDSRAAYFRQAANGKYVRMALLKMILDKK